MKTKLILSLLGLLLITGCSKTAGELFELSNENLKDKKTDQAIEDLETLVTKYPQDSLASQAQYKLASINLNWKNELASGYAALQATVNNYGGSIQAIQAQKEIDQFPEYILNKAESLRKRKKKREAIEHLMYLVKKFSQNENASTGHFILGQIYMSEENDFKTAIQEFRKVVDNYQGSIEEVNAQFMIGYNYANNLNDLKSAEIEYKIFLEKFPNDGLADDVEYELKHLGMKPEEFMKEWLPDNKTKLKNKNL